MIGIVRIQSQEKPELLWNEVIKQKDALQLALGNKGRLLYLSKRCKHNEASLFMHVADTNVLGDFIARHLAVLPGVDSIWLINMLKPVFFPLSDDARQMKRFTVTVKAYSPKLPEIYDALAKLKGTGNVGIGYLAYTFHLFGDSLQISFSAMSEADIQKYVSEVINNIPGVLASTVCEIEKTHPFISYEEWHRYTIQHPALVEWDEQHMVAQFKN